jgi:protein gp37
MGESTNIEWTDATVNFWWGCTKVGPGCANCYAETHDKRFGGDHWGKGKERRKIKTAASLIHRLDNDYSWWGADHWAGHLPKHCGSSRRVFIQSMSDLFDTEVPIEWFTEAWGLIEACNRIDIQIVTKRISDVDARLAAIGRAQWPKHAGLLITVVNQAEADRDVPRLLELKVKMGIPWVGLSIEPMLGPIDLTFLRQPNDGGGCWWLDALCVGRGGWFSDEAATIPTDDAWARDDIKTHLDWIIAGGESGKHARPSHPDWFRSLRDQCAAANVPFLFKQWGEWFPTSGIDVYCHGVNKNQREFPNSEGIAWFRDGRILLRDFSVAKHKYRIATGQAFNSAPVDIDKTALLDLTTLLNDRHRTSDNPLGLQWMYHVGKKSAGRLLDGIEHTAFPESC